MGRLFGTDGVRGRANADLTPALAMSLAAAAARVLAPAGSVPRPQVVVGRDPRASGEMLEAAVCAGLTSAGVDAVRVGVVPTPAVAHLTAERDAAFGVMISASHNPMPDNGIKLFAKGGHKLADDLEDEIEAAMAHDTADRPTGADVGRTLDAPDAVDAYLAHLGTVVGRGSLDGLTVVVDCANGAASVVAPRAYAAAGATVIAIHDTPDGLNINADCGSTHLDRVQAAVREHGADLGLAHDGDADRCLAVDAAGDVVDGDGIMAILATGMREQGVLTDEVLVTTVMSNLGLHKAMRAAGIALRTTGVGDRYVLDELRTGGYALGGEQSGHIVMPAASTTGDGVLTGLSLMARMAATGRSLAELAGVMTTLPQVLINVSVTDRERVAGDHSVTAAVREAEQVLGEDGRILLRPSGTEQLVRVMVEATTEDDARRVAEQVAGVVSAACR
ncbi:phosphoglucosamine mutase [Williamsia sterculiae]|uniref:Phosphoglucosamine mutase n=1 Tax=Williamsia sterculiae TaxID=1344003 RepID=A0A1N7DTW6_9NOCA|nr:phosphoglucosamine mutase [Williamsia sterculiae]SIR79306.1 phosphoglucosamine mutase [Williamsia sterculiae]